MSCSGHSYYRLPQQPGATGSWANYVRYAYFTVSPSPRSSLPPAFQEFNPDTDAGVTFILHLDRLQTAFAVKGILRRPDGNTHVTFQREVPRRERGEAVDYMTHEDFPMPALAPWQGAWTLELFAADQQIGRYRFVVADKTSIPRFRVGS